MRVVQFGKFYSCLLCSSPELQELKGYEKKYLVICRDCNFVFCNRVPTQDELKNHYLDYPRDKEISPITISRYHQLLDYFERFRKTNNIIDVGCGDGHFLQVAKTRNWNVYGVEFTKEAVEVCQSKGIEMKIGPLSKNCYSADFFDIITSFEVIEHINNPSQEAQAFQKFLRTGGLLYVTTPNFNSISRNLVGSNWGIIGYPEHLCYYTRSTLTKLFAEFRFQRIKSSTTGLSLNRITQSDKSQFCQNGIVNMDFAIREKAERTAIVRWLKIGVNFILNLFSKGDDLKAYFIKL